MRSGEARRVAVAIVAAAGLVWCAEAAPVASVERARETLARSDGTTDDAVIVAALDELRSMGPRAAPAAETLSALLRHNSRLYRERDKFQVVRLRSYIMVTLTDIGFPDSAMPALLDTLVNLDERMSPIEIGAAARAAGSRGASSREFAPYLLEILDKRISPEQFSLERFEPRFPEREATTVQVEAIRALARICSAQDREVIERLRTVAADPGGGYTLDAAAPAEARRALAAIGERR